MSVGNEIKMKSCTKHIQYLVIKDAFLLNFQYQGELIKFGSHTPEGNYYQIGVVSGKAIFGPPLEEYWKKKLEEEAAVKETDSNST
ncbi:hypothetical protein CsSME_00003560 [Camellia sinensis var. sinensis]